MILEARYRAKLSGCTSTPTLARCSPLLVTIIFIPTSSATAQRYRHDWNRLRGAPESRRLSGPSAAIRNREPRVLSEPRRCTPRSRLQVAASPLASLALSFNDDGKAKDRNHGWIDVHGRIDVFGVWRRQAGAPTAFASTIHGRRSASDSIRCATTAGYGRIVVNASARQTLQHQPRSICRGTAEDCG